MAELLVQDTSLSAIANVIREKTKTDGNIAFPDGFVEAIAAMNSLPYSISAMTMGEYIPSSTITKEVIITHNLGVPPDCVITVSCNNLEYYDNDKNVYFSISFGSRFGKIANELHYETNDLTSRWHATNANVTDTTVRVSSGGNSVKFYGGETYFWIAVVLK